MSFQEWLDHSRRSVFHWSDEPALVSALFDMPARTRLAQTATGTPTATQFWSGPIEDYFAAFTVAHDLERRVKIVGRNSVGHNPTYVQPAL